MYLEYVKYGEMGLANLATLDFLGLYPGDDVLLFSLTRDFSHPLILGTFRDSGKFS